MSGGMLLYTALFTESGGGGMEPLGAFSDFDLARAAVLDYAVWRAETAAASPSLVQASASDLTWKHFNPSPHTGRFHELWVARDGWMNYFLVWRVELGMRAWRQQTVAERVQTGKVDPPWGAWFHEALRSGSGASEGLSDAEAEHA